MKRIYQAPKMEIEEFDVQDTICTSAAISVTRTETQNATGELPPLPIGSINTPD